jgi:hypothetical protein
MQSIVMATDVATGVEDIQFTAVATLVLRCAKLRVETDNILHRYTNVTRDHRTVRFRNCPHYPI